MTAAITLIFCVVIVALRIYAHRKQPPVVGSLLRAHDPRNRIPFRSKRAG